MGTATNQLPQRTGRPPKFEEPSRPVTVTLPESTLQHLRAIDQDRGRAIVKLAGETISKRKGSPAQVEIVDVGQGSGIIIVGPSAELKRIAFLDLVEVASGRYLLVLGTGHDFKELELALSDILEGGRAIPISERNLLKDLMDVLNSLRRGDRVSTASILLVALPKKTRSNALSRAKQILLYSGGGLLGSLADSVGSVCAS